MYHILCCSDAILEPLFEEGLVSELLNEILVQIGLIKVC